MSDDHTISKSKVWIVKLFEKSTQPIVESISVLGAFPNRKRKKKLAIFYKVGIKCLFAYQNKRNFS